MKITEQHPFVPDDYYGIGKVASELLLKRQLKPKGVAFTDLRLPGVYGPGDEGFSSINIFTRGITQEGQVTVYGDGSDRRNYLYIEDVYRVVDEAIKIKCDGIVNVVGEKNYSILEIIHLIETISDSPCAITFQPVVDAESERIRNMQLDNSYLRKIFPQLKLHSLSEGITAYLDYLACGKK